MGRRRLEVGLVISLPRQLHAHLPEVSGCIPCTPARVPLTSKDAGNRRGQRTPPGSRAHGRRTNLTARVSERPAHLARAPGYCRQEQLRRQEPAGGRVTESPELSQDTSLGPVPSRTGRGSRDTAPAPAAPHLLARTQPCSPHILRILGERPRPASSCGAWNRRQVSVGKAPSPLFKNKRKPTSRRKPPPVPTCHQRPPILGVPAALGSPKGPGVW